MERYTDYKPALDPWYVRAGFWALSHLIALAAAIYYWYDDEGPHRLITAFFSWRTVWYVLAAVVVVKIWFLVCCPL